MNRESRAQAHSKLTLSRRRWCDRWRRQSGAARQTVVLLQVPVRQFRLRRVRGNTDITSRAVHVRECMRIVLNGVGVNGARLGLTLLKVAIGRI